MMPEYKEGQLVLFDFDGTLTVNDSLRSFLAIAARKNPRIYLAYLDFIFLKFGLLSNATFKIKIARKVFSNVPQTEIESVARSWFESCWPELKNTAILEELQKAKSSGSKVYIVSANFAPFISFVADQLKVNFMASDLEIVNNGQYTGQLSGLPLYGEEKLRRCREVFSSNLDDAISFADDESDSYLMNAVKEAIWI